MQLRVVFVPDHSCRPLPHPSTNQHQSEQLPTSTVSPPPIRSISSSAISSGNSLASTPPAVTPSLSPTSRSSFSPAKPPWPDNEQANRRPPTKGSSFASSLAFAKRVVNLPRSAINNLAAPRRSPSPMIRSVRVERLPSGSLRHQNG